MGVMLSVIVGYRGRISFYCYIYYSRFRNYCLLDYDRDLSYVEQLIKYLTDVKDGRASDYQERCKYNVS